MGREMWEVGREARCEKREVGGGKREMRDGGGGNGKREVRSGTGSWRRES